ncbi:uncharacterized protein LOC125227029 [Leguminivora glycinivorella]|uniref:uncharacterized protein LOC125227029 n=1 Tax=Leguminivora glycinivorella TaxID=1035111 RepID=UPI00200C69C7|nr:uncharacterized protein LOC125227029 [Leguminivora glycinivorella]
MTVTFHSSLLDVISSNHFTDMEIGNLERYTVNRFVELCLNVPANSFIFSNRISDVFNMWDKKWTYLSAGKLGACVKMASDKRGRRQRRAEQRGCARAAAANRVISGCLPRSLQNTSATDKHASNSADMDVGRSRYSRPRKQLFFFESNTMP